VIGVLGTAVIVGAAAIAFGLPGASPALPASAVIRGEGWSGAPLPRLAAPNAAGQNQVFYISGTVSGLYPGSASALNLSVQNPLGSPITVKTITIVAGSPSSGCPSSVLVVPPSWTLNNTYTVNLSLSVPANSTVPGPSVPITLATSAGDACSGANFPLMYGGTASG
jgi:hypothetical protein